MFLQAPSDTFMQHKDKKTLHEFILIAEMSDLEFQSQMEASSTACWFFMYFVKCFFLTWKKLFKVICHEIAVRNDAHDIYFDKNLVV